MKAKIIVGFFCIGLIALGLYFLIPSFSQKSATIPQNTLVTNETTKANSLDVPFYPHTAWKKIEQDLSNEDGINRALAITANDDYIYIPFTHGAFYKAQSSLEYPNLESFYEKILEKEGWTSDKLKFKTFSLQSLIADSSCTGAMGYIGYRDEFVKIISIERKISPCDPPDSPDSTPYPSSKKLLAEYTIFISDPKSIEEIEDYIATHPNSEL